MTYRILCVCLGNICRSPTAEVVLKRLAEDAGLTIHVDSAGTGGWHIGDPPDARMQAAGAAQGYDLSGLRARQVSAADFDRFDQHSPAEQDVPDPYYEGGFDHVIKLIEQSGAGLMAEIGHRAEQA